MTSVIHRKPSSTVVIIRNNRIRSQRTAIGTSESIWKTASIISVISRDHDIRIQEDTNVTLGDQLETRSGSRNERWKEDPTRANKVSNKP